MNIKLFREQKNNLVAADDPNGVLKKIKLYLKEDSSYFREYYTLEGIYKRLVRGKIRDTSPNAEYSQDRNRLIDKLMEFLNIIEEQDLNFEAIGTYEEINTKVLVSIY